MSVQTYTQTITVPLDYLFKNITNENRQNLFNQPLQINVVMANPIYINNQFFYRDYTISDEIIYVSKDKLSCIKFGDFNLLYKTTEFSKKYVYNCCKKYKKRKYLLKRTTKINNEINRIINIEHIIQTEIIHNLNFNKKTKESHYMNCKNKIVGNNRYTKSLFLYELHNINENTKLKIINYINRTLNISIDLSICLEKLFIYFTICKILKNIELYKNYLSHCIYTISKDIFNLNTKYCMFNDVLNDRIREKDDSLDTNYSKYYIFKDYNTYAIDNLNQCVCIGYTLAFSKTRNKWNVFPTNNDNIQYYISRENIEYMLNFIKAYDDEGIDLFENRLH
jgi:hypothetical protein